MTKPIHGSVEHTAAAAAAKNAMRIPLPARPASTHAQHLRQAMRIILPPGMTNSQPKTERKD